VVAVTRQLKTVAGHLSVERAKLSDEAAMQALNTAKAQEEIAKTLLVAEGKTHQARPRGRHGLCQKYRSRSSASRRTDRRGGPRNLGITGKTGRTELRTKQEANPVAMATLQYCIEHLGKPSSQETGLFIWDTTDGSVILQTADAADGLAINLFLTSRETRNFKPRSD